MSGLHAATELLVGCCDVMMADRGGQIHYLRPTETFHMENRIVAHMKRPIVLMVWLKFLLLLSPQMASDVQWDSNHIRWDSGLHKYVPIFPGITEPHDSMSEKHRAKHLKAKEEYDSRKANGEELEEKNVESEILHRSDLRKEKRLEDALNKLNSTLEKVKLKDEMAMKGMDRIDIRATNDGNFSVPSSSSSMLDDLQSVFFSAPSLSSPKVSSTQDYVHNEVDVSMRSGGEDMIMTMSMTFSPWTEYKLTLLFDWLVIDSPFEFLITWLAVFTATILMHGLKYANLLVESSMSGERKDNSLFGGSHDNDHIFFGYNSYKHRKSSGGGTNTQIHLRSVHSLLGATQYGLSLLLMLVAMTFNSALFVALIVGYFVGDLSFFHLNHAIYDNDGALCH